MRIRPSTKLKVVTVHKLGCWATCQRRYFERYIRNLESVWLNRAYYYGSRCGAGSEALMQGGSWKSAQRAMQAERKRYMERYRVSEADREAIGIDERLIDVILQGFRRTPEFGHIKMNAGQHKIKATLRQSGLTLLGTKDGEGEYDGRACMFEEKCLKRVSDMQLADLAHDLQVNSYAYSDRLLKRRPLGFCVYMIFRKPSKWIKRGQSVDDFVEEIAADVVSRPAFYYIFRELRLGRIQVEEVGHDLERLAFDLNRKQRRLSPDELLDPHCWPRTTSACANFSGCEYRKLCTEPGRRDLALRDYQMRELRYDEEQDELA